MNFWNFQNKKIYKHNIHNHFSFIIKSFIRANQKLKSYENFNV